jgi:hypothetical protein
VHELNEDTGVSTFLFALPSGVEGAARIMDLTGTFDDYNRVGTPEQCDAFMLWLDWLAVGEDLKVAIRTVLSEQTSESHPVPVR